MAKDVVRSGVTFEKELYSKLDSIVVDSKRYKIDKSEIINAILSQAKLSPKEVQKIVMDWREKDKGGPRCHLKYLTDQTQSGAALRSQQSRFPKQAA